MIYKLNFKKTRKKLSVWDTLTGLKPIRLGQ